MSQCTRFSYGIRRQELHGQASLHETTHQTVQEQFRPHSLSIFGQRACQIGNAHLLVRVTARNVVHKGTLHIRDHFAPVRPCFIHFKLPN